MDAQRKRQLESRALLVAMWGNLLMALAGILGAVLSNSTAVLMDGLFSMIGFAAALLGRRITLKVDAGPDRLRPLGYAADEAIFSTFRALSLLGLVLFAAASAGLNIYRYISGAGVPQLHFGPLIVYFVFVFSICLFLWAFHFITWWKTGKVSDILRLEAKASLFDAVLTAAAGAGLGAVFYFQDGVLAPVAPIGDSLVVLLLCLTVVGQYRRDLLASVGELAGVTASPRVLSKARRAIRASVAQDGGEAVDLSVTKLGRTFWVNVYYDPKRSVWASEVDQLNLRMIRDVRAALPGADVFLMVSEHPRRWPQELNPY